MPHYNSNNILVVTYEELVPKFYKYETLRQALHRSEKRGFGLKRISRGHNGGQALIAFDSLPEKIRLQMDDPRIGRHVMEDFFEVDSEAVNFYQSFRFADGRSISGDSESGLQSVYMCNASVIKAVMKLRTARINEITTKGHRPKKIWESLCNDTVLFKDVLKKKWDLEMDLPENPKRFKDKCEKFMQQGYISLISEKHGNANSRKVCTSTMSVLESLFSARQDKLGYTPTYTDVERAYDAFLNGYIQVINNDTGELYNPKEFKPLSASTIKAFLASWESRIGTHVKRKGNRQQLISDYKPAHKLQKSEFAGSLVSVDDRQPPFEYEYKGKGKRAWFYIGIDDASECWISWVHTTDKISTDAQAGGKDKEFLMQFYRQMVRNCHEWGVGIPLELEGESHLNSTLKTSLLMPGNMFKYVRIEANNARGKIVERYIQELRYREEKHLEGFINRHNARREANRLGSEKPKRLTYERIIEQSVSILNNWNNSPHPIHTEKTRLQVFLEHQNPSIEPINWYGVLKHGGHKTSSSCRVGQVRLQGGDYLLGDGGQIYLGEKLINLMRLIEGEQVDVYWLDGNDGNVIKAHAYIGDQFICELLPKPSYKRSQAEQTEQCKQARKIMSAYESTVTAFQKRKYKSIEDITVIETYHNLQIHNEALDAPATVHAETSALQEDVSVVTVMPEPNDELDYELATVEKTVKNDDPFPNGF